MAAMKALLLGFIFSSFAYAGEFVSVCDRTPQVRKALERQTNISCGYLNEGNLQKFSFVQISDTDSSFHFKRGDLSGLKNVAQLNIIGAKLERLQAGDLEDVPNLTVLDLRGNQGIAIDPVVFKDVPNLLTLILGEIGWAPKDPVFFEYLGGLKALFLNKNGMTSFKSEILGNARSTLMFLDLSDNNITEFADDSFAGLNNLQNLKISGNPVTHLQSPLFSEMPNLEEFEAQGISIDSFDGALIKGHMKLSTISLGSIRLNTIADGAFENLNPNISVFISDSPLKNTNKGAFRGIRIPQLPKDFNAEQDQEWTR